MEREKNEGRGKRPEEGKKFQDDPSRQQGSQPQYGEQSSQEGTGAGQESGDLSEERETMGTSDDVQNRDLGSEQGRGGKRSPQSKDWNQGSTEKHESDVTDQDKEDLP